MLEITCKNCKKDIYKDAEGYWRHEGTNKRQCLFYMAEPDLIARDTDRQKFISQENYDYQVYPSDIFSFAINNKFNNMVLVPENQAYIISLKVTKFEIKNIGD
ncbi:MAG: hypothetical protein M1576_03200 [Deltaproteobacteria bacterium]|jgi:hypothetical protein|nr:hypothetical protein [Deltaproteobacteria bacterium]